MKPISIAARIGSFLILRAIGFAQSSLAPFSLTIAAAQTELKAGSELMVRVTLTNLSNHEIMIGVTRPLCDYVVEVRDSVGNLEPPQGHKRASKCRKRLRSTFVWLKPNESMKEAIEVSELFNMSQPDEYSVQVMRKVPHELGDVTVRSNTLDIGVTQ